VVEVQAIRFDDVTLATAPPTFVRDLLNTPRVGSDRLVIGAVVVQVMAGSDTECFRAVDAYIRTLN